MSGAERPSGVRRPIVARGQVGLQLRQRLIRRANAEQAIGQRRRMTRHRLAEWSGRRTLGPELAFEQQRGDIADKDKSALLVARSRCALDFSVKGGTPQLQPAVRIDPDLAWRELAR